MTSSDAKLTWACGCTQDPLAPVGEYLSTCRLHSRRRVVVDLSDPATIERAAEAIKRYRRGMKHVYVYDERRCFCGESFPDEVAGKAHLDRSLAAAVLASLTDTGDNKEQA